MNNMLSNEQIAHDLAIAFVSAKLSKETYISSDISVIRLCPYNWCKF